MGQQFGWWQLSSLHHRIAKDILVGKVGLAFKVSLEGKAGCAHGGHMVSVMGRKKSVFTSDFCHLFSGRRSWSTCGSNGIRPTFVLAFWIFLFIPHCFWMFENLRAGGLLFRNICSSHCCPLPPPSMDEVYFSTLQHWVWQPLSLAFGMIVGQPYQKFKMSNALGIALWRLSFHSGKNVPGRARWSQEEDSRPVEHRDTSLTPPAKPTSVSPQRSAVVCGSFPRLGDSPIWDQLTSCWSSDVWVK